MTLRTPSRQKGVGLIEILITVLVLAIGLLGLAGLQMTSMRNNQSSAERSVAIVQSYSIIEAIRADIDSAKSGRFNINADAEPAGATFPAKVLTRWRQELKANLGDDATGSVSCSNTRCTIVVQWDDSRGLAGSEAQQFVTEVYL